MLNVSRQGMEAPAPEQETPEAPPVTEDFHLPDEGDSVASALGEATILGDSSAVTENA